MKIAFISSEVEPFSKTGGLADVAGSLPRELEKTGNEIVIVTPFYRSVKNKEFNFKQVIPDKSPRVKINNGFIDFKIYAANLPGANVKVLFIESEKYFDRKEFYTNDPDEAERFVFFQKAALETLMLLDFNCDIMHVNDWQGALIPFYLKEIYKNGFFSETKTLLTIHNIGYQGTFDKSILNTAEIPQEYFYPTGPAEFYGKVNFLKLGIVFADKINTVSETYAQELLTPEFSGGLDGVLLQRKNDLSGILNGVDYSVWSPEKDKLIPVNYSFNTLEKKEENKKALVAETGLIYEKQTPLLAIVSRLVSQKGFDLFLDLFDFFIGMDAQLVVLGSGEEKYETFFSKLAFFSEGNVKVHIGYNNNLAHLIEAGADIFLMPSLYEPCGLNQIYSLKYGTVPVVRKTGGLADTVKDWDSTENEKGNGFSFEKFDSGQFRNAVERALKYYSEKPTWRKIQKNGMSADFSWKNSATQYENLYKKMKNS